MGTKCLICDGVLRESYVYNSETGRYERMKWDGHDMYRCWNCGYFTQKFLDEHPNGFKKEEIVFIDGGVVQAVKVSK